MKFNFLAVAFLLVLISASGLKAQEFTRRDRFTTFGVSATAANYFGDLAPGPSTFSTNPELTRFSIGAFATRKLYPRLSVRAAFSFGRITGSDAESTSSLDPEDAGRRARNLSFRNDIKELSAVMIYDLVPTYGDFKKRSDVTPYIFLGSAVFYHSPKAFYDAGLIPTGWYDLQSLQTEGINYSKIQPSIPFGGGFKIKVSQQMDLGIEFGWRKTFTDYLDDVSSRFEDKGTLNAKNGQASWVLSDRSIELAETNPTITGSDGNEYPVGFGIGNPGLIRGDRTRNDWYAFTGFTLTYIIDKTPRTPKFR